MAFGAERKRVDVVHHGRSCYSTIHAFLILMSSFLFSMQTTQVWKCVFDLIDKSFSTEKKQKRRHNIADCTPYLYINMCMIDASFENSSCLFSLLNKLTTCYTFCITV